MGHALREIAGTVRRRNPRLYGRLAWMYKRWRGVPEVRVVDACVRRGDVVVDVGASWGLFTHRLARLVGRGGHVHAIEPNPAVARSLRAIQARYENVTLHHVALSDRAGEATLHVPLVAGVPVSALGSLGVPPEWAGVAQHTVRVPVTRLDALLPPEGRPVAFVKCDVEGHELAALRGAEAVLRRSRPVVLVEIEHRHQTDGRRVEDVFEYLAELGYAGYVPSGDGLRPLAAFDLERDQLAFLGAGFMPYEMPAGYVHEFLFLPSGTDPAAIGLPRA